MHQYSKVFSGIADLRRGFLRVGLVVLGVTLALLGVRSAEAADETCFATPNDGALVYTSTTASAVRDAVAAAGSGGTVKIAGYCAGAVNQLGTNQVAVITQTLTLAGGYTTTNWTNAFPITQPTTLDALLGGRVLFVSAAAIDITSLTIQNGSVNGDGAGIYSSSALTLTSAQVLSNSATGLGGGVYLGGGDLLITGTTFANNVGTTGGGAVWQNANNAVVINARFERGTSDNVGGLVTLGTLDMANTTVLSNTTTGLNGGAMYADKQAVVTGGLFENNTSALIGGGMVSNSTLHMSGTQFISNSAAHRGGGLFAYDILYLTNTLFMSNTVISGSPSGGGGGGLYAGSRASLAGNTFVGNSANSASVAAGGAAYLTSQSSDVNSVFQGNRGTGSTGNGGAIAALSHVTMTGSSFLSNTTTQMGGGIFIRNVSNLVLSGTTFVANSAAVGGAGVWQTSANATSSVTNARFERGTSPNVGGLKTFGSLNLTDSTIISNTTTGVNAGAVYVGGFAQLSGDLFQNNSTAGNGGAIVATFSTPLVNTQFVSNSAAALGGAVFANTAVQFTNGLLDRNSAGSNGGGVYVLNGNLAISGTQLTNNSAGGGGGGAWQNNGGSVQLTGGLFQNNVAAGNGGGVVATSTLTMLGTQFISNSATLKGGGIYQSAGFFVGTTGGLFERNSADTGGGIYQAGGPLTISGTVFTGNSATNGAGVWHNPGNNIATVTNARFESGVSNNVGGLVTFSPLTLNNSTIISNTTTGANSGAVYAGGLTTIVGTLFQNNRNAGIGGALVNHAPTNIRNSQFISNSATNAGGGIYAYATLNLTNTQFLSNTTAGQGGGFFSEVAATVNGGLFVANRCTSTNCISSGWFANTTLALSQFVTIADSIKTQTVLTQAPGGVLLLNGTDGQTIGGTSMSTLSNVEVANTGAGVHLGQDVTVTNRLTLTTDLSTLPSYRLNLTSGATSGGNGDVWGLTSREHAFSLSSAYPFGNPNVSVNLTAGTPPTGLLVNLLPGNPIGFSTAVSRTYLITPTGGGAFTATLRLRYRDTELNGNPESNLALWRNTAGLVGFTPSLSDTVNNWLESDSVTAFSPWFIAPNPIALALFVTTTGTGIGVVTPTVGSTLYGYGTVVTLTASANTGSTFAGWSGACAGMGDCPVTMTADRLVTATFVKNEIKVFLPLITK